MTKRKSAGPNRLASHYVPIRPEGGRKVPYRVPDLPAGKFTDCDGQLLLPDGAVVTLHQEVPWPSSVLTSMFMHGSWMHVIGNMWYLWIFGDNVEDRVGHGRFIVFYLLCGILAALGQVAVDPHSTLPTIGASGAIAGVMGAYFVLYPRSRIVTLVPIFIFIQLIEVPAIFFLGIWFLMQFLNGVGSIAVSTSQPTGGVAFWAHVAGFATGIGGILVFRRRERRRVEWWDNVS